MGGKKKPTKGDVVPSSDSDNSSPEEDYVVERIVDRREKNGKVSAKIIHLTISYCEVELKLSFVLLYC